jgi:hypothetical protein
MRAIREVASTWGGKGFADINSHSNWILFYHILVSSNYEMILNMVRFLFMMRNARHHERHANQDAKTCASIPQRDWGH